MTTYYCKNFNKIYDELLDKETLRLKTKQAIDSVDYVSMNFIGLLMLNINRWVREKSANGEFDLRIERSYKNSGIDLDYVREKVYDMLKSKSYDPIIGVDEEKEILTIYLYWDF